MLKIFIFSLLLASSTTGQPPQASLKTYSALYCPYKQHWEWQIDYLETNDGKTGDETLGNRKGEGREQLQFIQFESNVDNRNGVFLKRGEIDLHITHSCTSDGKKQKMKEGYMEIMIPLGEGEVHAFKALHLGRQHIPTNGDFFPRGSNEKNAMDTMVFMAVVVATVDTTVDIMVATMEDIIKGTVMTTTVNGDEVMVDTVDSESASELGSDSDREGDIL